MPSRRHVGRLRLAASLVLAASTVHADRVVVFAAASLTDAFRTIGREYEAAHPTTTVELNFAGSSTLVRQIVEGAPADVLACADEESMRPAAAELAGPPLVFARNRLAIVVQKGNPRRVASLADLARRDVTIALAAPAVPIGRYARDAFGMASLPVPTASDEADARAVVTRVAMGEADAGVVYATDVVSGGEGVEAVAVPEAHDVVARYPIATLKGARNAEGARTFVAWVLSPLGRRALAACGFLAP